MKANNWRPNPHFRFPKVAPNESEEGRLFSSALRFWLVRRNPARDSFPYPLSNARMHFRHTLAQWRRIGEAKGNGISAARRARTLRLSNGPWINWPEMTITAD